MRGESKPVKIEDCFAEPGAIAEFRAEKMTKVCVFDVPQMFLDVYCLEPGQAQKPHAHSDAAKIYYVLEGEGVFLVGTEERNLGPGHAAIAPAGEEHGVRNESGERLRILVAMAPNPNH
jgi:quercetin dioxygenase-like cupin family protein